MNITQCPRCREEVRVPQQASAESRVRCPLCQEEFLLREVLEQLPPLLELLDAPVSGEADAEALSEKAWDSSAQAGGGFSFGESNAVGTSFGAGAGTIRATPRAKRREQNPVVEIAKMAGGGLAGLILAQLILWWIPGNFSPARRDFLNLAPKVAKYAPFLVPAPLQGRSDIEGTAEPITPGNDLSPKASRDAIGNGRGGDSSGRNGESGIDEGLRADQLGDPSTSSDEEFLFRKKEPVEPANDPLINSNDPAIELDPAKNVKPAVDVPKPAAEEPKPAAEEPKPTVEEPKPTVEEPKPAAEEPKPKVEEPKAEEPMPAPDGPKLS